MKLLVATDIFGETPELFDWLMPVVEAADVTLQVVSPYPMPFTNLAPLSALAVNPECAPDQLAYQRFILQGGIDAYAKKLQLNFDVHHEEFIALGFSAGAAALWQLAAKPQLRLKQLLGFYGGQIRHCSELQPLVSTTLIWAQEAHFDVDQLHRQLQQMTFVQSNLTPYQHGFINPHSVGYNREAASDYQQWLIENVN
jgi:hypothetical protein